MSTGKGIDILIRFPLNLLLYFSDFELTHTDDAFLFVHVVAAQLELQWTEEFYSNALWQNRVFIFAIEIIHQEINYIVVMCSFL